jgi:predicted permease
MVNNLIYSVNAILPIVLLVALGWILKKAGKITDAFTEVADWLVFKVGLPVMLFLEVAESSLEDNQDGKLILFLVIAVTTSFTLMSFISLFIVRDPKMRGAFIQGSCRSNFAILGVPLAQNMFGEVGGSVIALTMPFVILMFNSYSVIVLSVFSGSREHKFGLDTLKNILKSIVTNPLIIGVVLGLPFMIWKIPLVTAASKTLHYLSGLTTPLALMSLGANFRSESLKGRAGYAVLGAMNRTLIIPAAAVTAAALCGLRGPALGVVLICFGAPTAVSSYIMAKKMDNDHELAAQILLLSTAVCVFTIFIGIFILKSLGLIEI